MPKESKIEKKYHSFEEDIHKIAEEELNRIAKTVEDLKQDAEKVGEEIESSEREREKRKE